MKRFKSEVGRAFLKKSFSNVIRAHLVLLRELPNELCYAFRCVGPGSTELTVTFVPAQVSARPRATASCAVFVVP